MQIKKAVITSAGFGTRFLPVTKTVQKEMLPILNRPLVDYVVEDCIKAGIEEIIFVVSEHNKQIRHFYSKNTRLQEYLERMGKPEMYAAVEHLHSQVQCTFVVQPDAEQYGTAIPVKLAREHLENEDAFLVFMGDDFIYNADGSSEAERMIERFTTTQSVALATCIEKPAELLHKYGVVRLNEKNGERYLLEMVEKPALGTAPSNLVNISKYVFTPAVFDILESQELNQASGELYITDTVTTLVGQGDVVIHTPSGEYLDGGYVAGWIKANLTVAKNDPELMRELAPFV
ncbi:MAG: NTP transferase domain-containing protein [Pseudomonadales bacterium]|nr:NTP transferase domain-containing protein [Candidatus Woesebacteria bacterium]MCB9801588.1 NTP transferase domain-containing protein [Pseudomonadales bacterium]